MMFCVCPSDPSEQKSMLMSVAVGNLVTTSAGLLVNDMRYVCLFTFNSICSLTLRTQLSCESLGRAQLMGMIEIRHACSRSCFIVPRLPVSARIASSMLMTNFIGLRNVSVYLCEKPDGGDAKRNPEVHQDSSGTVSIPFCLDHTIHPAPSVCGESTPIRRCRGQRERVCVWNTATQHDISTYQKINIQCMHAGL